MKMTLSRAELLNYVCRQLDAFFPDGRGMGRVSMKKSFDQALERVEFCFSRISVKYFREGTQTFFNHLHGDHYAMFLYLFANSLFRNGAGEKLTAKLFLLNRCLHGIDAYFEVELPDIFLFVHPLGTVLGRARYSNYFLVYQACNIGSNKDVYPVLGEYVSLHPGASVLGSCEVGHNSKIAAGSLLLDRNLKANSLYIGNPKGFVIKDSPFRNSVWA